MKNGVAYLKKKTSSVRIHQLVLMSSFMRHLPGLGKFWQRKKKWDVDSASKLRRQNGFIVS